MDYYFDQILNSVQAELKMVDIDSCDISIEKSSQMIKFLHHTLMNLRGYFLQKKVISVDEEINFFKNIKPEILGQLLYFNKIYTIELKRPMGSNEVLIEHYKKELDSMTFFFNRHIDFYQYYRSKSTHLDDRYFLRDKNCMQLCDDSHQFDQDPLFSTIYDHKIAKINCNELLRTYLNKKIQRIEKQVVLHKSKDLSLVPSLQWTAPKVAAVEFGYALFSSMSINNGNVDIKDIMMILEANFNIDLGDYYRTYLAIKSRKKDRTPFLNKMKECLNKKIDDEDVGSG